MPPTPEAGLGEGRSPRSGERRQIRFSIVCLSSVPWRTVLPTNRQQIMARAAARGHEVLFVETGGSLPHRLLELARGPGRRSLARRLLFAEKVEPRIRLAKSLNALPWGNRFALVNRINSALSARLLSRMASRLPQPVVLWIYDPCAGRIAGACGERVAVYDCVDDYPEQVGWSRRRKLFVAEADSETAKAADLVFATTRPLQARLLELNRETHLVPNVGDYPHFSPAQERSFAADEVRRLEPPVVGFAGNLVRTKVDFDLLRAIATARPEWTLLLVGPVRDGSRREVDRLSRIEIDQLEEMPNVRWLGGKPYAELPHYVAAFDVGIIPYVSNHYTRSCFPLKVYEYLAAGKPVVASGLPELAGMEPHVTVADGAGEFIGAVEAALERLGSDERTRRVEVASRNTWETRTARLLELIEAKLGPSS